MSRTSISKARSRILERVRIHSAENSDSPSLQEASSYLSGLFTRVEFSLTGAQVRGLNRANQRAVASSFASARVRNPDERSQSYKPMYGEVEYELRIIEGDARAGGVIYDGRKLAQIHQSILADTSLEECHIVVTDRLISTFSDDDLRHHLRTVVFGFPSVISIPGIVEAPARPREYWIKRRTLEASGASQIELERLKAEFKGRFLDFDDPLIPEVLKGIALQCIMYHLTLEPFCDNKDCRLFNAHWQEDLIRSQIDKGSLCSRHSKLVSSLGRSPTIKWMAR